jgi:ribosomal protein S18 acetylase RimI-like enzyme
MMVLDPDRARLRVDLPDAAAGTSIERVHRMGGEAAAVAVSAMGEVLAASFGVEPERQISIELEALQGLQTDAFHAVLARVNGQPAAVARRTTFAGASYLSSIGTKPEFRSLGLGRLVTSIAIADALAEGSRWTYLGVFEENTVARTMYEALGFAMIGGPAPDLLLRR